MEALFVRYVTVKFLQVGYDNIYTKRIKRFEIKMILLLLLEIVIVSITNHFFPRISNTIYSLYNYINMVSYINFIIGFTKIKSPILEYIHYIIFIKVLFSKIYVDCAIFVLLFVCYFPKRKEIYFYAKHISRIILSNLNREMKILGIVYIILFVLSLIYL